MLKLLYEQESLYLKYITTFGLCFYYQLNLSVGIFFFYYIVRFTDPKIDPKICIKRLHYIPSSLVTTPTSTTTVPFLYFI